MDGRSAGLVCLATLQCCSFTCAVYVLVHCLKSKTISQNISNHVIICLLAVATWAVSFDLFNMEYFYWNGYVLIQTEHACRFYNLSYFSAAALNRMFMAFMSLERHLLVFHHQLYRTRRSRQLCHYFPILLLFIYVMTCSLVGDVFLTCPALRFRYNRLLCGYTCTILSRNLTMFYIWVQIFTPVLITTVACVLLPIRFVFQKQTLQRMEWRRSRKMIVQMCAIAGTYTISWIPYTIVVHLGVANIIPISDGTISTIINITPYVSSLAIPFICFHTVSEKLKSETLARLAHFFFPHRFNRVNAQTISVAPNQHRTTSNAHTATAKPPVTLLKT